MCADQRAKKQHIKGVATTPFAAVVSLAIFYFLPFLFQADFRSGVLHEFLVGTTQPVVIA
jgi:mannose/fructose/N-acetylgalactosamine-specific phosphotransferase system component IIC